MSKDIVYLEDPQAGVEDYRAILAAVLNQAIDDYVVLMHPKRRKRKYLQEFFLDAVDMFFDDSYRMNNISNEDGEDMSLSDLICALRQTKRPNIQALRKYVIQKAQDHWSHTLNSMITNDKNGVPNTLTDSITIPQTVQTAGRVYRVFHTESEETYCVDYEEQTIYLNTKVAASHLNFCKALTEIMVENADISIEGEDKQKLSDSFYMLLILNDCFSGD